jgi:peroxiredoxin
LVVTLSCGAHDVPPASGAAAAADIAPAATAKDPAAPMQAPADPAPSKKLGFEEARRMFAERGVQPGQPLPPLSLVDLDGKAVDLAQVAAGKPLVLITCSLTCNVARNQQKRVDDLRARLGDRAHVVMLYTIEAHPNGAVCPYTGSEWVPQANVEDQVLVGQPATMTERLALARRYATEIAKGTPVLVDPIGDPSWRALGEAPNLGLAVSAERVVLARTGWCDVVALEQALERR